MGIITEDSPVCPSVAAVLRGQMESFLDQDLFSLVIHPTVDFRTGLALTGEALSRLDHPEYGAISAEVFIRTLDDLGLYARFDRYVFRKCCLWLQQTARAGRRFDCVACNFSRKTLSQEGIVRDLIRIADSCSVPHHKLGIEITEWTQTMDPGRIRENLTGLKEAGFRIILDDYGSGVTSESDLYDFPLDIVKIDGSLLRNTGTEQADAEFRALVAKFLRLGAEVVCEGIETEVQSRLARETGCHYGQGFLYYRPLSPDSVLERICQPHQSEE